MRYMKFVVALGFASVVALVLVVSTAKVEAQSGVPGDSLCNQVAFGSWEWFAYGCGTGQFDPCPDLRSVAENLRYAMAICSATLGSTDPVCQTIIAAWLTADMMRWMNGC